MRKNESEFLRLQNFIKDNPNGGTFIMEDDMLMGENYIDDNDTLYTNHQTYTIETNQHQIIMENYRNHQSFRRRWMVE